MPLYEFKCGRCGLRVEKLQKYEHQAPKCGKCAANNFDLLMDRQLGRCGFRIEGPGVYSKGFSVYK